MLFRFTTSQGRNLPRRTQSGRAATNAENISKLGKRFNRGVHREHEGMGEVALGKNLLVVLRGLRGLRGQSRPLVFALIDPRKTFAYREAL